MMRLGSLYAQVGRKEEAEQTLLKSLRIRETKLGANHSRVGQTLKHLLTFYEENGMYDKAAECGERALKITETVFGLDDINVAGILLRLSRLYMSQKKFPVAKATLKRALNISTAKFGEEHPYTSDVYYEFGCYYFTRPERLGTDKNSSSFSKDKAEKYFIKALKIKEATVGKDHPDVSRILTRLGSLYIERVEYPKAEDFLKRSLKIRESTLGSSHTRVAQTLKHLLTLYELQEKFDG